MDLSVGWRVGTEEDLSRLDTKAQLGTKKEKTQSKNEREKTHNMNSFQMEQMLPHWNLKNLYSVCRVYVSYRILLPPGS